MAEMPERVGKTKRFPQKRVGKRASDKRKPGRFPERFLSLHASGKRKAGSMNIPRPGCRVRHVPARIRGALARVIHQVFLFDVCLTPSARVRPSSLPRISVYLGSHFSPSLPLSLSLSLSRSCARAFSLSLSPSWGVWALSRSKVEGFVPRI